MLRMKIILKFFTIAFCGNLPLVYKTIYSHHDTLLQKYRAFVWGRILTVFSLFKLHIVESNVTRDLVITDII
jgi:hypothetical protein